MFRYLTDKELINLCFYKRQYIPIINELCNRLENIVDKEIKEDIENECYNIKAKHK